MGDFNATSWLPLFEEWTAEEDVWCLNDPTEPTINTGSSIDKCLFRPGFYIPSSFVPREEGQMFGHEHLGLTPYPAIVLPEFGVRDHFPLILPIPCDVPQESFTSRKLEGLGGE